MQLNTCLTWAVGLLLLALLGACADPEQRPTAPLRVRLKSITSPALSTTLSYNTAGQLSSFSNSNDSTGSISYDSLNRYQRVDYTKTADRNNGWRLLFDYPASNPNTATLFTYSLTNGMRSQYTTTSSTQYTLDGLKQPTGAVTNITPRMPMGDYAWYQYTGDNITQVRTGGDNVVFPFLSYEYDDKPNPLYGLLLRPVRFPALIRPPVPSWPSARLYVSNFDIIRQYSRNNITKITFLDSAIPPVEYSYQYNEQGLPVTITEKTNGTLTRLTYEPY